MSDWLPHFHESTILLIASAAALVIVLLLCLCCTRDSNPPFPRKNGYLKSRILTDRGCAALFVLGTAVCGLILAHSFYDGSPKRLTHGYDWQGNVCGFDEAVKDKKMLYFCGSPQRAVSPAGNGVTFPKYLFGWSTTCVSSCPTNNAEDMPCLMPAFHNMSVLKGGNLVLSDGQPGPENLRTLDVTVTQSLVNQPSYPTEAFGGRFCLPSKENIALRDTFIDSPSWSQKIRPWLFVGSLVDAWVLVAMSVALATILNMIFFHGLKKCAGCMIFISMILAMLLLLAIGLVLLWVIFLDSENPPKDYAKINPIFSIYRGKEAEIYSITLGIAFTLFAGMVALVAFSSMKHIDEMVGLISAACECLESNYMFAWVWPLSQTLTYMILISFIAVSLPYVASLATLQKASIEVDGHMIEGMQRYWHRSVFNIMELMVYVIFCAWAFEVVICLGNYIVAYVVAEWYFVEVEEVPVKDKGFDNFKGEGKHVHVRVGGVDQNAGERAGVVTIDPQGNKVLVVAVGKKGPGLGRNNMELVQYKKTHTTQQDLTWLLAAETTGIFKHLGSFAMGAPIIALFRIPCLAVKIIQAFVHQTSEEDPSNPMQTNHVGTQNIRGTLSLLTACLNQVFGKYTQNAIREIVLTGGHNGHEGLFSGFLQAATDAYALVTRSGGSLCFLSGSLLIYEFMGCVAITAFTGWSALVVQDKVDWFNDPTDPSYIENKNASALACCFAAFCVSFSWMSTWNQTADTLLYCVAWNRKQWTLGHEFELSHDALIKTPAKYCPQQLRYLVPSYELDPHYEHGVHAHGIGQMGSIIAAMEHGAMTKPGAPNYATGMGSVFHTGTKIIGS